MHDFHAIASFQQAQPAAAASGADFRSKSATGLKARECVVIPGKMPGPDRPLVGLGSPVRMAEASHAFLAAWQSPCRGQPASAPQPASPRPAGFTPQPRPPRQHPDTSQSGMISRPAAKQANQAIGLLKGSDGAASAAGAVGANRPEAYSWVQPSMQAAAAGTGCSDAELSRRVPGGMSLLSQSTPELPKAAHSRAALRYANLDALPDTDFEPAATLSDDNHAESSSLRYPAHVQEVIQPGSMNRKPTEQLASMHAGACPERIPQPMPNLLQAGTSKHQFQQPQTHQAAGSGAEPGSPSIHPGFRMSVPPATPASISPILERAAGRLTPGSAKALERMRALHMQRNSGMGTPPGSPLDAQVPTRRDVSSAFEAAAGPKPSRLRHQAEVAPSERIADANNEDVRDGIQDWQPHQPQGLAGQHVPARVSVARDVWGMQQPQALHGALAHQLPASNLAQKLRGSEAQSNGSQKRSTLR